MTHPPMLRPMRARVVNPDADRYAWEGEVVSVLDESDLQQRTTWVVVRFPSGEEVAYHRTELELTNV